MFFAGIARQAERLDARMAAWRFASEMVNKRVSDNSISQDSIVYLLTTHTYTHESVDVHIHMDFV